LVDSRFAEASLLGELIATLSSCPERHAPTDPLYRFLHRVARQEVERCFAADAENPISFGPFGNLVFPFRRMGAITSLELFGLDELIIFAFYWANRRRYRRVVDFGANIGLHSIVLSRCGFDVRCFEPDPEHLVHLHHRLSINSCASVDVHAAAVSVYEGRHEFVRVVGNTTGSHLSGAKPKPYGTLERFEVRLEAAAQHLGWADLAKMDIEGHEAAVLTAVPHDMWATTDVMVEIGNADNAAAIFEYGRRSSIRMFAQKIGWRPVTTPDDMPTSHHEGSLFISAKHEMPWAVT
jgi:FkbM family methyltransferase